MLSKSRYITVGVYIEYVTANVAHRPASLTNMWISKLLLLTIQEIYAPIIEDHNPEHTTIRPIEQRDRSLWWEFCMWQYITGINFMHRNPKLRLLFTHCHQVCDMIMNHGTAMKPTVACHINFGIRWYQNICTGYCSYVIVFNKGSSTVMVQTYLYMYCFFLG